MPTNILEENFEELDEAVTFHTHKHYLKILLRPTRTLIVDGQTIKRQGVRAEFRNHKFVTKNSFIVDKLRELLASRNAIWTQDFSEAPSAETLERAMKVKERISVATSKIMAEVDDEIMSSADKAVTKAAVSSASEKAKKVLEPKVPKKAKNMTYQVTEDGVER